MSHDLQRRDRMDGGGGGERGSAPGKRTLTQRLRGRERAVHGADAAGDGAADGASAGAIDGASEGADDTRGAGDRRFLLGHEPAAHETALPADVAVELGAQLGADFGGVRIVTDDPNVVALGAGAASWGETIHFAPGRYDPSSAAGRGLIAHELAHVQQQRHAGAAPRAGVAGSDNAAEHEAEAVQHAIARGEPVPAIGAAPSAAIHLGEAGVHRGIELEAAGVDTALDPDHLKPGQRPALEMYAGNFMRDFSQFQVPKALDTLAKAPTKTKDGKDSTIGMKGAKNLIDAVIQAIAILELGPDIAKQLVKPPSIGVYEAEHHIDNPMGNAGPSDFVVGGDRPHDATHAAPRAVPGVDLKTLEPTSREVYTSDDPGTVAEHTGSAVPGLQYENPKLYEVSDAGLANHVYNSTEHAKQRFLEAAAAGVGTAGRVSMGMGLHIVEDYFAHSNFIEVALNEYIDGAIGARANQQDAAGKRPAAEAQRINGFLDHFVDARGHDQPGVRQDAAVTERAAFVDTLYDQKTGDGSMAVTTGSFGGDDTKISIAHVLLPQLGKLEAAAKESVDGLFAIAEFKPEALEDPTWAKIERLLAGESRSAAAGLTLIHGADSAGLRIDAPVIKTRDIDIPLTGRQLRVPTKLETQSMPMGQALIMVLGSYAQLAEAIDKATSIPYVDVIALLAKNTLALIRHQAREQIKVAITTTIRTLVIDLFALDPQASSKDTLAQLAGKVHQRLEPTERRTSLQSRLSRGGDLFALASSADPTKKAGLERRIGPVKPLLPGRPIGKHNPWIPVAALPPSHTEIAKDHPGHIDEKPAPGAPVEPDGPAEDRSLFYGLHRVLAVDADRHFRRQIETVWNAPLLGGKTGAPGAARIDDDNLRIGHGDVMQEAGAAALAGSRSASAGGRAFAQRDQALAGPAVRGLLDLVDLYISHPAQTRWWRPMFDDYIAGHADEVHADILARNRTRGRRK